MPNEREDLGFESGVMEKENIGSQEAIRGERRGPVLG